MNNENVSVIGCGRYFPYGGAVRNVIVLEDTGKRYKVCNIRTFEMPEEERVAEMNRILTTYQRYAAESTSSIYWGKRAKKIEKLINKYGHMAFCHYFSSYVTYIRVALD